MQDMQRKLGVLEYISIVLLALFVGFGFSVIGIEVTPSNQIVYEHQPMEMSCGDPMAFKAYWLYRSVGVQSYADKVIFNGNKTKVGFEMFVVDHKPSSKTWVLSLNSTQITNAGTYICQVFLGTPKHGRFQQLTAFAQLIVTGTVNCRTNLSSDNSLFENEYIFVQCSFEYSGDWTPKTTWNYQSRNLGNFDHGEIENVTTLVSKNTVSTTVTVKALATFHRSIVICQTVFQRPTMPHDYALNNPDFFHLWKSASLTVLYKPRNLLIVPHRATYYPGDNITCSADANPTPSYTWKDTATGNAMEWPVLVIDDNMIREPLYTYECTAVNSVGIVSKRFQFHISQFKPMVTPTNPFNIVVIAVVIVVIILAAVVALATVGITRYIVNLKEEIKATTLNKQEVVAHPAQDAGAAPAAENKERVSQTSEVTVIGTYEEIATRNSPIILKSGSVPDRNKVRNRPRAEIPDIPMKKGNYDVLNGREPVANPVYNVLFRAKEEFALSRELENSQQTPDGAVLEVP